ncbi:MAG TPA: hypothetical protein VHL98_18945 [Microvirga sp.]|nr:hypothetical protein [Microvirga sp.]
MDRKLDHAVKETFPTSDPVSVTITKGGAIDYDQDGRPTNQPREQGSGGTEDGLLGQAKAALGSAATGASDMARGAYEQGRRYAREASERYPQAERYYREGTRAVREHAPENPVLVALLGAVVGYGIAWMIHHERWRDRDSEVPRYARTRERYPFAK